MNPLLAPDELPLLLRQDNEETDKPSHRRSARLKQAPDREMPAPPFKMSPQYEQLPASSNIDDRRQEQELLSYLLWQYTGFRPDQWAEIGKAFFTPIAPIEKKELPATTADPLATALGYNDLPHPRPRLVPAPDWWLK